MRHHCELGSVEDQISPSREEPMPNTMGPHHAEWHLILFCPTALGCTSVTGDTQTDRSPSVVIVGIAFSSTA